MKRSAHETVSVWVENKQREVVGLSLAEAPAVDVCIVGAGIAGLTTAYLLQKEGKSVAVVDRCGVAAGETQRTTAHVTAVLDDRFFNLEFLFGEEKVKRAAESHRAAIDCIENIVRDEGIDCDFERVDGYLVALNPQQREDFEKEAKAVKRAGFAEASVHKTVPFEGCALGPALQFPQQACFHALNYMTGLAHAFKRMGGRIYTGAHVVEVKGGTDAHIRTDDNRRLAAGAIIVATNTPINDLVKMHTKQAAYRTYVVGFAIPKDSYPPFLLWDMQEPYHYVRLVRGDAHDIVIVGGEDHKTGQANDAAARYERLENWARLNFSGLGEVLYKWSGQIMEPVDSLAFIGRNPMDDENVYIATGDSGNGITHGTIAGLLLTDLIMNRKNPWEEIYDPARKSVKALPAYLGENANAVGKMVTDWVRPGEVASLDEITVGEGAILRQGASKVAVYKDAEGETHTCSAVCTHLGCIVQWNGGEKSWDCPCHGSRFGIDGSILNGPAIRPLGNAEHKHPSTYPMAGKSAEEGRARP